MSGCQAPFGGHSTTSQGGPVSASSVRLDYGTVVVGSSKTLTDTIINGSGASVTITGASASDPHYRVLAPAFPVNIAAGQSASLSITFRPKVAGNLSGNIAIILSSARGGELDVAVSGRAVNAGNLVISPVSVTFGNVPVGQSGTQSATLTNSGGSTVMISSAVSNSGEFLLSGLALPVTLAAGQSASFAVTFAPQSSGATSGSISFSSDAANPTATASVSGTGIPAPQHSVSLSWTASTSNVVGYNVYRGSQSGGPYAMVNSSPDTSATYADSSVREGTTYYYVVTAVDGSGTESIHSNQVQAVVPTP